MEALATARTKAFKRLICVALTLLLLSIALLTFCLNGSRTSPPDNRQAHSGSLFTLGSGVRMGGEIQSVCFNSNKGFRFEVAGLGVGLVEVEVVLRNNSLRNRSLLYAGPGAIQVPMTVAAVEFFGALIAGFGMLALAGIAIRFQSAHRQGNHQTS
jgi:hypothetical protein